MKLEVGQRAPTALLETIQGRPVPLPDPGSPWVHLQFRRFAGCPVCNFHLMGLARRHDDLQAAGVRQVVVFHSAREEMLNYQAPLPFDCIADPQKRLYRQYGVETSLRALLHPSVFWSGMRWVLATRRFYRRAENGIQGLPADFLIDARGQIIAVHYGRHADDQWDADEVLRLARTASSPEPSAACVKSSAVC